MSGIGTSCGCIALQDCGPAGRLVPPQSAVRLSVIVDIGTTLGLIQHQVIATFATGAQCSAAITADVVATYRFEPSRVDFGIVHELPGASPPSGKVAFRSTSADLLEAVQSDADWLAARTERAPDGLAVVALTLLPERLPAGESVCTIVASTSDPEVPQFPIQVCAYSPSVLIPVPRRLFLDLATRDYATVSLIGLGADPPALSTVTLTGDAADVSLEFPSPTEIGVCIRNPPRASQGTAIISVSGGGDALLRIPVYWRSEDGRSVFSGD